jgi:hypothetical protein
VPQNLGDPLLNVWTLAWDSHILAKAPLKLFQANIFYPARNSLAFSEHMISSALIALPFNLWLENPIVGLNIVFLFSIAVAGFGGFLLVKHYTGDDFAAFIAGLIFAFGLFKFSHIGHLQIMAAEWIPFILLFADKFIQQKNWTNLLLFTGFYLLEALACWYYAIQLSLIIAIYFAYYFLRRQIKLNLSTLTYLLASLMIVGAVMAVFAKPYLDVQNYNPNFKRSLEETIYYSAGFRSYLTAPPNSFAYGKLTSSLDNTRAPVENRLFPGLLTILFAFYAFADVLRKKMPEKLSQASVFYLITVVLSILLSFGPYRFFSNGVKIPLPYLWLYYHYPAFKAMRVPARFGIIAGFALSVLAGIGIYCFKLRLQKTNFRKSFLRLIYLVVLGLFVLDLAAIPIPVAKIAAGNSIPPVYKWLRKQKKDLVVLELPFVRFNNNSEVSNESLIRETLYVYYSSYHWKRLVNGYSGYFPESYIALGREMQSFPSARSIETLSSWKVNLIIIHQDKLNEEEKRRLKRISDFKDLHLIKDFGNDLVYSLPKINEKVSFSKVHLSLEGPKRFLANQSKTMAFSLTNKARVRKFFPPTSALRLIVEEKGRLISKAIIPIVIDPKKKVVSTFLVNDLAPGKHILKGYIVKLEGNRSKPEVKVASSPLSVEVVNR